MELLLQRFSTGDESTLGILHKVDPFHGMEPPDRQVGIYPPFVPSEFRCFTMEDQPNEPKIPGETRIPAGRYRIGCREEGGMHSRYSKKFPWHTGMLWLRDVPGFTFVYIHYGNYHDDTDGCILVGDGAQSNISEDGMVMSSIAAYTRLAQEIYAAMDAGEEIWITIEDFA